MASSSPNKRREMDIYKLMMTDYKVELENDSVSELNVQFKGPKDSPYEGGLWIVRVELPEAYPYKSPSIGFMNKIFHPNIDEGAGSVCLDVINQTWSPMFDLVNIFEVFLPQLLLYPNAADPLNGEAAALHMRDPKAYERRVREHVRKHASPEAAAKHWLPPTEEEEADADARKTRDKDGDAESDGGFLSESDDEGDMEL